ncbi:MAG: hypothetical protein MUC42_11695 [Bryobacter sp.]|nr:hypothetical protein [Bryobacter sp.]
MIAAHVPAYLEGTPTSRFQKFAPAPIDISTLTPKDIRVESGAFFHHRRILPGGQLLFFTNHGSVPARGALKLAGKTVSQMDPLTGKLTAFPEGSFELPPSGSLLLYASSAPFPLSTPRSSGSWTPVAPAGALRVDRASPNVLSLDYCDLTLGGKTEAGLHFYPAAEKVFQNFGIETNPWNTAVQYKTAILDRNRFAPDSAFRVDFPFTVEGAADLASLQAVVERAPLWRVSVNGHIVSPKPGAWWFDRDFAVYEIGAHARTGRNVITLAASPMTIHHELEPVYVLGNFNVRPAERGWTIVPAAALAPGDWTTQGLPHYGHSVVYSREFRLEPRRSYKVRLGDWKGSVAEVRVNGRPAGLIGWPPYECDITAEARAGINRIEVVVTGSPRNHQGPYHGKPNPGLAAPGSFRAAPYPQPAGAAYQLLPYGLQAEFQVLQGAAR